MKSSAHMAGSYILLISLPSATTLQIGGLGEFRFSSGYYAYVGSAMSGIIPRLRCHMKKNKTPRWHIDYLTVKASINSIIISESQQKIECSIAKALESQFACVAGFGSSDCKCTSHLFFVPDREEMKSRIEKALGQLGYSFEVIQRGDIRRYLGFG